MQTSFPFIQNLNELLNEYQNHLLIQDKFNFTINKSASGNSNNILEYELLLTVNVSSQQCHTTTTPPAICNQEMPSTLESNTSEKSDVIDEENENSFEECIEETVEINSLEEDDAPVETKISNSNLQLNYAVSDPVISNRSNVSKNTIKPVTPCSSIKRTFSYKLILQSIKFNHKVEPGIWQIR